MSEATPATTETKPEEKAPEESTPTTEAPASKTEDAKKEEDEVKKESEEKKVEVQYGDEEENKQVKLENKDNLLTGTEDEEPIWVNKAKLYRFRNEKWKERGNGICKILRNKETKKIRFLLRTEKTKKVSANFYIADSPS